MAIDGKDILNITSAFTDIERLENKKKLTNKDLCRILAIENSYSNVIRRVHDLWCKFISQKLSELKNPPSVDNN